MQEQVLEKLKDPRLKVFVVWTNVFGTDNTEFAKLGKKILKDPRVTHYWDGSSEIALKFGKTVELPRDGPFAYDVYFAYGAGAAWKENLPLPADWLHQIVDDERFLEGPKMLAILNKLLKATPPER